MLAASPAMLFSCANHGYRQDRVSIRSCVAKWQEYNGQKIRIDAIFAVGREQAWLYDPGIPDENLIDVEFDPHIVGLTRELDAILKKNRRANVTFEGFFHGPEPYKIDSKLPPWIQEKLRKGHTRYGHMGSFDYMISVTSVLRVAEVPSGIPWK